MFGSKVRYGITYKQNQKSFDIYRRKYMHNLKVCVDNEDYEGAIAAQLKSMKAFLLAKLDRVRIFDSLTYELIGELPITLLPTETREPNEIIGLAVSKCERFIGVISGKNLILNE